MATKRIDIKLDDQDPLYQFMVQRAKLFNMGVLNYAELVNRAVYLLSIGDTSLISVLGCTQAIVPATSPSLPPNTPTDDADAAIDDELDRLLGG